MSTPTTPTGGTTFVLVPGAWCGAWIWEPVARGLRARGHPVHPITLTGLDSDADTDVADIGLQTHVQDVLALLHHEDLRDVVLVGHSYSGIVVGQAAGLAPDRVAHTVFLEAFLPRTGRSLLDAFGPGRDDEVRQIDHNGGWWPPPTAEGLAAEPDLTPDQVRWLLDRLVGQPGRTVREPAELHRPLADLRATYVACSSDQPADEDAALRRSPTWSSSRLDAGHFPMVSVPDDVVAVLHQAV